jgi:membrane protease YdiL (CAAX protease family)
VLQAALFGYAHSYQNPIGIVLTGCIGLVVGFLFLATGHNLWLPITAHACYDTARVIGYYLLETAALVKRELESDQSVSRDHSDVALA